MEETGLAGGYSVTPPGMENQELRADRSAGWEAGGSGGALWTTHLPHTHRSRTKEVEEEVEKEVGEDVADEWGRWRWRRSGPVGEV